MHTQDSSNISFTLESGISFAEKKNIKNLLQKWSTDTDLLRGPVILGNFSVISKMKELALKGNKFFPFRVVSFSEGM